MTVFAIAHSDPPLHTWMRRIFGILMAAFLLDGAVSAYRAWVQVFAVTIRVATVVEPGSTVHVRVKTSGRTFVEVRLELVQSGRAETLAVDEVPKNQDGMLDPRPQRRDLTVALSPALWTRFHSGHALLRATAIGRPQWFRTPPPTVCELAVGLR